MNWQKIHSELEALNAEAVKLTPRTKNFGSLGYEAVFSQYRKSSWSDQLWPGSTKACKCPDDL